MPAPLLSRGSAAESMVPTWPTVRPGPARPDPRPHQWITGPRHLASYLHMNDRSVPSF